MHIDGIDNWLTSPPDQTDWVEEGEKFLKQKKSLFMQPRNQEQAYMWSLIEGLVGFIKEELEG